MRKLDRPSLASTELFDASINGMPVGADRTKFQSNRSHVVADFDKYTSATTTKTWCHLPRVPIGRGETLVCGALSKTDLVSLYDDFVVGRGGRPREIYDQIKLSSFGECPYCGGVGDIGSAGELGTLDHFLPKARFPAYSVLPENLIPACRTCNAGKSSRFPTDENLQPLHPYLDEDHFFEEVWIVASVREETPIVVDFEVDAPPNWSVKDQSRIKKHFENCNLASRYRARVHEELTPLISQRKSTLRVLSVDQFRGHLEVISGESELPINGWKRTLYRGLAASNWFCSTPF